MSKSQSDLQDDYRAWSRRSGELIERAKKVFPGGDTRASAHYPPYPNFVARGEGCTLIDEDGHEIVDFMNNFTSLIHGHGFGPVVDAVTKQVRQGTAFAAPALNQVALAELLVERVPSLELMRFCSSGSEATLMTIRCARAVTGRQKIMKIEGGYHGSYELAEVSLVPFPDQRGQLNRPNSTPVDASIPDSALNDAVIAPFNESDIARRLIDEHKDDLAAVIVEPILGSFGMLPAEKEFLQTLRDETKRAGVILIFDEVISLRLNPGGAQQIYGVTPDLTAMGKIIGGGLPIGAFGGRADLMSVFDPNSAGTVMHASTFSGNPLSMAAGYAAMSNFGDAECAHVNALGDRLRAGCNAVFKDSAIRGQAVGFGSLTNLHLTDEKLKHARNTFEGLASAGAMSQLLHLGLLRRGIYAAGRLMMCTSTPMANEHVDRAVEALSETLAEIKPVIETERPELLR
jgi:glutamate-1-semialdehyde 2,1-aminomutase